MPSRPKLAFFHQYWGVGEQINLTASDYWRLAIPAAALFERGWDVILGRCVAQAEDGTLHVQDPLGDWYQDREVIVWGQWMGEGTADAVRRARAAGQVIINDLDDDYWRFPEQHVAARGTDPEKLPLYNRDHYRETLDASSLVVVSTPHIETIEDWAPPVRVVRNYIDLDAWPLRPPGEHVGWVGMLPWRGSDLELLRETVVPWLRERDLFFYHGGHIDGSDRTAAAALGYDRVTTRPPSPIFGYAALWEPLRVALCPVDDTPFGRGKSWVKALEACARGVPFIASDHAEYRALGVGRIAERPEDWTRHLDELEDPGVYAADVARNRRRAEELSIARNVEQWESLFTDALALERSSGTIRDRPAISAVGQKKKLMSVQLTDEYERALTEIPSATTLNERKLALYFASDVWDGRAHVFENGPLLGGATRALALGMLANKDKHGDALLHTYDWFSLDEPLDLADGTMERLVEGGMVSPDAWDSARWSGSFLPVFEALHRGQEYWPLVRPHVGYLRGHRENDGHDYTLDAPDYREEFGPYSLAFVDGCKSWYGTKHWITELSPRLQTGAHVLFQDMGQYTCFWLPMLVGLLPEYFALRAYVDHTYAYALTQPLTPGVIAERFPDEPRDLSRAEYDRVLDALAGETVGRGDALGQVAIAMQRAAAYSYLGLVEESAAILDGMLRESTLLPIRDAILRARRSPTYTPEGPILLPV